MLYKALCCCFQEPQNRQSPIFVFLVLQKWSSHTIRRKFSFSYRNAGVLHDPAGGLLIPSSHFIRSATSSRLKNDGLDDGSSIWGLIRKCFLPISPSSGIRTLLFLKDYSKMIIIKKHSIEKGDNVLHEYIFLSLISTSFKFG